LKEGQELFCKVIEEKEVFWMVEKVYLFINRLLNLKHWFTRSYIKKEGRRRNVIKQNGAWTIVKKGDYN